MSLAPITALSAPPADIMAERAARRAADAQATAGNPRALARLPKDQQIKAVGSQFEAIFLRQFLQESVSKIMGGDSGEASGNVYGYLLTDVLASKLSEGGGLGLAASIEKQLSPRNTLPDDAEESLL